MKDQIDISEAKGLLSGKRRIIFEEVDKLKRGEWADFYWLLQTIPEMRL